jgi:glycogen synthase
MRILMTADTVGGVWTYALELIEALEPFGAEVALATQGARLTADQRSALERLANARLYESDYRLEWMQDPWADVDAAGEWLHEIARSVQPDVIHFNEYSHAAWDWSAPVLTVGHSCVGSWFRSVRGCEAPGEWNAYRERVGAGLRKSDLVVAPTRTMLAWLDELYGPLRSRRVILNGRDPERFHHRGAEPFIFVAGRCWDEAKNIGALVAIAERLKWPVRVAGLPHPDGDHDALAAVEWCGRLDSAQMADMYSRAGLYVLPAYYEPFGLSALEAAMSGCPLVLGDIPSLRELWDGAAEFVAPGDREALAWTINHLIEDAEVRLAPARRAQARAAPLTARRMAARYLWTYRQLASAAPRRAIGHLT